MKWQILLCAVVLGSAACDSGTPRETPQAGTPERAQRDSVLGQSKLPGARAVQRAQDVEGAARARAAALDSIQ